MNRIETIIKRVQTSGGVILVDLSANDFPISAMLVDVGESPDWLKEGNEALAIFKETDLSIAKDFSGKISFRNQFPCLIRHIQRGELMSIISLTFQGNKIDSAITTRSVDLLELKVDDAVTAFIKANEVTLMKK